MKKLKLEDLAVESFATTGGGPVAQGTVRGAEYVTYNEQQTCGEANNSLDFPVPCTQWTCNVLPSQCGAATCNYTCQITDCTGGGGGTGTERLTCQATCAGEGESGKPECYTYTCGGGYTAGVGDTVAY
jgi:hypothetical protein